MRPALLCALWLLCPTALLAVAPLQPRVDHYGDPLPPGALVRLGTVRLRHAELCDYVCLAVGKAALTVGNDRVLRWWDLTSGKQTAEVAVRGDARLGSRVALSPDGKLVAAHGAAELTIWETASGKELKRVRGGSEWSCVLRFSSDNRTLAAIHQSNLVSLWDWRAGTQREWKLPTWPGENPCTLTDSLSDAVFSPDGKRLVARANGREPVCVFDTDTGRLRYTLDCRNIMSLCVSADGKSLTTVSQRTGVSNSETVFRLFDLETGKPTKEFPHGKYLPDSLAASLDGKELTCGYREKSHLFDLRTGRFRTRLAAVLDRPSFTADGKTLVTVAGDRLLPLDVATGKQRHERPGDFAEELALAVSRDGRRLFAAGYRDEAVSVWDLADGRLIRQLPLGGERRFVRDLALTPDGRTLLAFQKGGFLQSWDASTGREINSRLLKEPAAPNETTLLWFYRFQLSADGKTARTVNRVIAGRERTRLVRWDMATGKPLTHTLADEAYGAAWADGDEMVALPSRRGLTVVDADDGTERFRCEGAEGDPVASPDGRFLAVKTKGGVGVWEAVTGKEVVSVVAGSVRHFDLAPGNRLLLTADATHIRAWDLADGKERWRWLLPVPGDNRWHWSPVRALRALPDGRRVFVALGDGSGLVLALDVPDRPTAEKALAALWADLALADAKKGYAAVRGLRDAEPGAVVAFLQKQLRPVAAADMKAIRRHIADLDSDEFPVREAASRALAATGRVALAEIEATLQQDPPLEVRMRLKKLRAAARRGPLSPDALRAGRVLQVLEWSPSAEAERLLRELAAGEPRDPLTREAAAAVGRRQGRVSRD